MRPSREARRTGGESRTYMIKALREAKVHTSWLVPDDEYEAAALRFAESILDRRRSPLFLPSFAAFVSRVAELGIYNSLSQTLIKITAPGVPGFLPGHRTVGFQPRRSRQSPAGGLRHATTDARTPRRARDRRAKRGTTPLRTAGRRAARQPDRRPRQALRHPAGARQRAPDGAISTSRASTSRCGRPGRGATACSRSRAGMRGQTVITCVPRMVASLVPDASAPPVGRAVWADTAIEVPPDSGTGRLPVFADALTGATIAAEERDGRLTIPAAAALEHFPVALLAAV